SVFISSCNVWRNLSHSNPSLHGILSRSERNPGADRRCASVLLEDRFHKAVFDLVAMGNGQPVLQLGQLRGSMDATGHCSVMGPFSLWRKQLHRRNAERAFLSVQARALSFPSRSERSAVRAGLPSVLRLLALARGILDVLARTLPEAELFRGSSRGCLFRTWR